MKIAVCIKQVPSTTAEIRIAPDGKSLQLAGVETILNPYDEYALEAALRLREQFPGSTISAISAGLDNSAKALQHALSLGVDSAIHLKIPNLDSRGASDALAAALKRSPPDLILCGRQAIDDDQWEVPGALGELLDAPHITAVSFISISADQKKITCKRRFNRDEQTLEAALPCVVSCDKGLNEPRAASLKGRLAAKSKPVEVLDAAALGLTSLTPALRIEKFLPPPQKTPGRTITLPPADAAKELVRIFREELKLERLA